MIVTCKAVKADWPFLTLMISLTPQEASGLYNTAKPSLKALENVSLINSSYLIREVFLSLRDHKPATVDDIDLDH